MNPSAQVSQANVIELVRPFDPVGPDAEAEYDAVVRRINRARARRTRNERERLQLERQFIDDDLVAQTGPRKGLPLSRAGRRARLTRLIELAIEAERVCEEERFAMRILSRMNEALDAWARETYGPEYPKL